MKGGGLLGQYYTKEIYIKPKRENSQLQENLNLAFIV